LPWSSCSLASPRLACLLGSLPFPWLETAKLLLRLWGIGGGGRHGEVGGGGRRGRGGAAGTCPRLRSRAGRVCRLVAVVPLGWVGGSRLIGLTVCSASATARTSRLGSGTNPTPHGQDPPCAPAFCHPFRVIFTFHVGVHSGTDNMILPPGPYIINMGYAMETSFP
jgi:hypothetical protein